MSRYATEPDAETDNALSEAPNRCEMCDADVPEDPITFQTARATYHFCCDRCYQDFLGSLEDE